MAREIEKKTRIHKMVIKKYYSVAFKELEHSYLMDETTSNFRQVILAWWMKLY